MDGQNWHQRRMKWATRLEEVLNDFDALQLFQSWMGVDDDSSEHPLRLHFAIVAFREMLARGDGRAAQLAREIYNKFLRPKSGLCAFIDAGIRERVAQRLRHLIGGTAAAAGRHPPTTLFDECLPPLDTFLRKQHAIFVSSHEFLDKFNNPPPPSSFSPCPIDDNAAVPSCSSPSASQKTPARRSRKQQPECSRGPTLTADMLLRSQKEREAMVPPGPTSQRLFKPVSKFPYVGGQTQPSKNDSAVSSAFSSESNRQSAAAAGSSHSLRAIRDEQRRINGPLMATFPRLDHGSAFRAEPPHQSAASQFRHESSEGRQQFADFLSRKLHAIQLRHRQEETVKEQIERINSARQKGGKQSARELIGQGPPSELLEDTAGVDDADEELENYHRLKMAADSNSSANSAQQSPLVPLSRRTRRRSRGHGSCSPGAAGDPQQPWTTGSTAFGMSQSCCSANPSLGFIVGHQQQFGGHPFPLLESAERSFLGGAGILAPPSASSHAPPHFSPFFSGLLQHHPPPPPPPAAAPLPPPPLSQSMHLPPAAQPKAAPPTPLMGQKGQCTNSASAAAAYCDNDGDTSGIGSMTSATHSGTSAPGTAEQRERQRAAVFRKARELSSGGGAAERQQLAAAGNQQSPSSSQFAPSSAIPRQKQQRTSGDQQTNITTQFGALPHANRATLPQQPPPPHPPPPPAAPSHQSRLQQGGGPKMTISYRESGGTGANGVPVVAQIPQRPLTFREFRRILSISSKDRRQFFFKVACEDGTAPYQLLLVNDNHAILPVFDAKITAECRAPFSDSD